MAIKPSISHDLFQLLRQGLHPLPEFTPPRLTDTQWQELYALSQQQGVTALVGDGIAALAAVDQPPRDLRIKWVLQTEQLEKRHHRQEAVAGELAALFTRHNIRMLVLKGLGLGADYPHPSHRECGDIDIWLFGEFEKGNRVMQDAGAKITLDVPKHTELRWRGVPIENHRNFFNISRNCEEQLFDDRLCELLRDTGAVQHPGGFYTPSATFNALYLLRHSGLHLLRDGIVLRHVCDWAVFREHHGHEVDQAVFETMLVRFRMERFARLMTAAAIRCCGLQEQMPEHDPQELDRFISEILAYEPQPENENVVVSMLRKCRLPYENRWRFRLLGIPLTTYYCDALRAQWNEKFTLLKR